MTARRAVSASTAMTSASLMMMLSRAEAGPRNQIAAAGYATPWCRDQRGALAAVGTRHSFSTAVADSCREIAERLERLSEAPRDPRAGTVSCVDVKARSTAGERPRPLRARDGSARRAPRRAAERRVAGDDDAARGDRRGVRFARAAAHRRGR